ncbi:MAG: redox-regulated ATPase YchF [Chloroflexi bacterium]|nr:redox-regulated ATPase YchF [Chloroflexota bacterium]
MEVGIVGLPLAGKTTLFNALTRSDAQTGAYASGRNAQHTAVVEVADPRVDVLSDMFRPLKTTWAKVQFTDVSGAGAGNGEQGLDQQTLNALSRCDALVLVVRAFENDQVPHPDGAVDAARDLASLRLELILSDLTIVERRIERIDQGLKKSRAADRAPLERERALMERFVAALEAETPIADLDLAEDEEQLIRGFQFLSAKPNLVILNVGESDPLPEDLDWANGHRRSLPLALRGSLEMEIAQLPPEEMAEFLASYEIAEPGLHRLVREAYGLLGLMSFFTVGEDEVRAWTVRRSAHAVEAAGAIHSDLARGFIRAEVISYDDMIAAGTMAKARSLGRLRLEGKEYIVQDGDILNIRFNV